MFALFASHALCDVKELTINSDTEVDLFVTGFPSLDQYLIILNSGDFYDIDGDRVCPAILQVTGKLKFRHAKQGSTVPMKYAHVMVPRNAGFNVIINSITVPILLKQDSDFNEKYIYYVAADQQAWLILDSNNGDRVKVGIVKDNYEISDERKVSGRTEVLVQENKVALILVNRTASNNLFFMVQDVKLEVKLDSSYHYNCGPFYFTSDKNGLTQATDCAEPTPKNKITKLEGPETDVFIGEDQTINIPANSFVTIIKLSSSGQNVHFKATDKNNNGLNTFPQDISVYFKSEGKLEISSESVPYVRVNLINTENWPKDATIYVKPGLSDVKFTTNVNDANTANTIVQTGKFILVSANNYYMSFQIDQKSSGVVEKYYDHNGFDTSLMAGDVESYKLRPGAYAVTLPENGYCSFAYKANGYKYAFSDGFGKLGHNVIKSQLVVEQVTANDNLYLYIGVGAGAAVVVIIIIIIICCCCCKKGGKKGGKKHKKGKSSSSSSSSSS